MNLRLPAYTLVWGFRIYAHVLRLGRRFRQPYSIVAIVVRKISSPVPFSDEVAMISG